MSTPQYVLDFIKALCPEAPDLYVATFKERTALEDATERILEAADLRARLAAAEQTAEIRQEEWRKSVAEGIETKKQLAAAEQRAEKLQGERDRAWAVIDRSIVSDEDEGVPIHEQLQQAEQARTRALQEADEHRKLWLGLQDRLDADCYEHAQERLTALLEDEQRATDLLAQVGELRTALDGLLHCYRGMVIIGAWNCDHAFDEQEFEKRIIVQQGRAALARTPAQAGELGAAAEQRAKAQNGDAGAS